MIGVSIKRCIKCRCDVASVDGGGWCRGCVIAGHCTPSELRVLMAVRKLQPAMLREVADEVGYVSTSTAHYFLRRLREMGLVEWEDYKQGTITEAVSWPEGERV